jgi:hypothetical protein
LSDVQVRTRVIQGESEVIFLPSTETTNTQGQVAFPVRLKSQSFVLIAIAALDAELQFAINIEISVSSITGDITIEPVTPSSLVVLDTSRHALVRVLEHEQPEIITGCLEPEPSCGEVRGMGPLFRASRSVALENKNSFVVLNAHPGAVIRVNRNTGKRRVISGCRDLQDPTCSTQEGQGPLFLNPQSIAVGTNSNLVVTDVLRRAVIKINAENGEREIVSGCTDENFPAECINLVGKGPPFRLPDDITIGTDAHVFVTDRALGAVIKVNLNTGKRDVISGCPQVDSSGHCVEDPVGGEEPFFPGGIAVENADSFLVTDADRLAIIRVDQQTGSRSIISGCRELPSETCPPLELIGTGPGFVRPQAIAIEETGFFLVLDVRLDAILRVNPTNGNRCIFYLVESLVTIPNCRP